MQTQSDEVNMTVTTYFSNKQLLSFWLHMAVFINSGSEYIIILLIYITHIIMIMQAALGPQTGRLFFSVLVRDGISRYHGHHAAETKMN